MIRKFDETSTGSWFQRAAAPAQPATDTPAATVSAPIALADRSRGGWDPMEVWLRYIDQPRRLRQLATTTEPRRGD